MYSCLLTCAIAWAYPYKKQGTEGAGEETFKATLALCVGSFSHLNLHTNTYLK